MFVDARRVESGATIETDVCIVGAGAAGIALAREFAGGSARVVVLESGGHAYDSDTQALYVGERSGVPYFPLDSARLRFFGGTTNHWSGLCRPFADEDFAERSWIPHSGWPISRAELDPYYARAADVLHLPTDEFGLDYWREHSPRTPLPLTGRVQTRPAQVAPGDRLRLAAVYLDELRRAENVVTHLWANVTEFETDDAGTTVVGARVATLAGGAFFVSARHFVLAVGGIENPRLLLVSNRRHPRGLGNEHDLVGRFFLEHPRFRAGTIVPVDPQLPVGFYVQHGVRAAQLQAYLVLSEELRRAEELVDVQIRLEPDYAEPFERALRSPEVRSVRALAARPEGLGALGRHVGRVAADLGTWHAFSVPGSPLPVPSPEVLSRLVRSPRVDRASLIPALLGNVAAGGYATATDAIPLRSLALHTRIESAPNPDSRITLVRERDALGVRRVRLDWRLHELDLRSAVRAVELLGAELGRAGLGRLRVDVDPPDRLPPDIAGGWHHMGTTRMSDDPRRGVVDRHCRVHGLSNLFVAGSSVFPTAGSGTPTLTLVALALRLADHLKRSLA